MSRTDAMRVALVTGGSRGIGRAIAFRLADERTHVAVGYSQDAAGAQEACSQIIEAGGSAIAVQGDVGEAADVDAMFSKIEAEWGPVTVLVNNAGGTQKGLIPMLSDDDWHADVRRNLDGAFFTIRRAYRGFLRARWGRIVNVSSVAGWAGMPGQAAYAAAKAGLLGLTRSTARELGKRNVTCNVVAPGPIETAMLADMPGEWRERLGDVMPIARVGEAEEVAALVGFLCGPEAGYITGALIPVDGGLGMGL
jgi:3-oxoacyl-[acyl-carrier protein] reductase